MPTRPSPPSPAGSTGSGPPVARNAAPDLDAQFLGGCATFLLVAFGSFGLGAWPYFLSPALSVATLARCLALGHLPAFALGAIASRRFGLPAACGFVAGALTTSLFVYLRMVEVFAAVASRRTPAPDFPVSFELLFPLGWILVSLIGGILFCAAPRRDA